MFDWMTDSDGNQDIAPYTTLVGGGFKAASALQTGNENAKLLRANAAISGLQARSETQTGAQQADLYRQHLNATVGKQTASIGGSNITMSGSPLRALENTSVLGAQDIANIQLNAARKSWGFSVDQAGDELRADQASTTGLMNSVGGLITSSSTAYGQWQHT